MRYLVGAVVVGALGMRIVRSRHRRFMHPDGRSFDGVLIVTGMGTSGSALDGPVGDGPVGDGPVMDGPVMDGPVMDGPVMDGPGAGGSATGAALIDRPGQHPVTVRISKGIGTRPGRPDVLGLAVRVHGPVCGRRSDLLFSTTGRGRWTRHVPLPRRHFNTRYGSVLSYRTGTGRRKIYLSARPARDSRRL
ncbi:MAG TPA: hypothetical protein VFH03_16760, partial [Actinoplanes sp.]|nr:hypothetical protein [Actinoplanes sp.]